MINLRPLLVPPRLLTTFIICSLLLLIPTYLLVVSPTSSSSTSTSLWAPDRVQRGGSAGVRAALKDDSSADAALAKLSSHLTGGVIMPKLENATAKAELGRASWKLLHTMAARFPVTPTEEEKQAFKSFLYLFSRLYPCGECAAEFQHLLRLHPPQTSSRSAASIHLCHLHNLVNERLGKPEFDCGKGLEIIYDCGCGEDEGGETNEGSKRRYSESKVQVSESEDDVMRDEITGKHLIGG